MTSTNKVKAAETLKAQIVAADGKQRLLLQPKLHELLAELKSAGIRVPRDLTQFDAELIEESIEARFDNMPV